MTPESKVNEEQARVAFEAWIVRQFDDAIDISRPNRIPSIYVNAQVNIAWRAWNARATRPITREAIDNWFMARDSYNIDGHVYIRANADDLITALRSLGVGVGDA